MPYFKMTAGGVRKIVPGAYVHASGRRKAVNRASIWEQVGGRFNVFERERLMASSVSPFSLLTNEV